MPPPLPLPHDACKAYSLIRASSEAPRARRLTDRDDSPHRAPAMIPPLPWPLARPPHRPFAAQWVASVEKHSRINPIIFGLARYTAPAPTPPGAPRQSPAGRTQMAAARADPAVFLKRLVDSYVHWEAGLADGSLSKARERTSERAGEQAGERGGGGGGAARVVRRRARAGVVRASERADGRGGGGAAHRSSTCAHRSFVVLFVASWKAGVGCYNSKSRSGFVPARTIVASQSPPSPADETRTKSCGVLSRTRFSSCGTLFFSSALVRAPKAAPQGRRL